MYAYFINILLLIVLGCVLLWRDGERPKRKLFCILASLQWILLSGLRDFSVGADTISYKNIFEAVERSSWDKVLSDFVNIYFHGAKGKDAGYAVLQKLFQEFSGNYRVFLFFVALVFTVPLGVFIYRHSEEPCLSFLIYSCLFYSFFSITGHRQTIATALTVLVGYKFVRERRLLPFLLLSTVAFTIHKSSLCFVPYYFIYDKTITRRYLACMAGLGAVILVLGKRLYAPLAMLFKYDEFINNSIGGTSTYVLLVVAVMAVAFWRMPAILEQDPAAAHTFNAMFIGTLGTLMAYQNQSFMRFQQYYTLYLILLIPQIVKSFDERERLFVYYAGAALMFLLFAKNRPEYMFFWRGGY